MLGQGETLALPGCGRFHISSVFLVSSCAFEGIGDAENFFFPKGENFFLMCNANGRIPSWKASSGNQTLHAESFVAPCI